MHFQARVVFFAETGSSMASFATASKNARMVKMKNAVSLMSLSLPYRFLFKHIWAKGGAVAEWSKALR